MHNNQFLCPECRSDLKVKSSLVFIGENPEKERGIILFSPKLGDYQMLHTDSFVFKDGDHIKFICPVCQADLGLSKTKKELASVIMIDQNKEEYRIVFSEIAGKQVTIQVKDNVVVDFYGEDNPLEYMNIWGVSPQY